MDGSGNFLPISTQSFHVVPGIFHFYISNNPACDSFALYPFFGTNSIDNKQANIVWGDEVNEETFEALHNSAIESVLLLRKGLQNNYPPRQRKVWRQCFDNMREFIIVMPFVTNGRTRRVNGESANSNDTREVSRKLFHRTTRHWKGANRTRFQRICTK